MLIREFTDGDTVAQAFVAQTVELRSKRDGSNYLRLVLGDRTGSLTALMWDNTESAANTIKTGSVVIAHGRFSEHERYGPQLTVSQLRLAEEGEFDLTNLLAGPPQDPKQMEADLHELIATVQNLHLRTLLDRLLGRETETGAQYLTAPAAKRYHQAYRHGLLEHSLTVAQAVSSISATFPGINRDVAVTGALLHDIGKLESYTNEPTTIELTDAGKLQGEIPLGYYKVRRTIEDLEEFPPDLAQAVLHIILSHHGSLEHGSPVVPCTREATLVHAVDNLGGKLGSFDRLERALADGEQWSPFDRALGSGAYFSERPAA